MQPSLAGGAAGNEVRVKRTNTIAVINRITNIWNCSYCPDTPTSLW